MYALYLADESDKIVGGTGQSGRSGFVYVGAGIGGGVGIVIIFVVILLIFVCWKKSQKRKQR